MWQTFKEATGESKMLILLLKYNARTIERANHMNWMTPMQGKIDKAHPGDCWQQIAPPSTSDFLS